MNPQDAPITYLLLRTDLSDAQQIVQACHAAMAAAARFGEPAHNHLCLLAIRDEAQLQAWARNLTAAKIGFEAFFEPDHNAGYTALCTQPLTRAQGRCFRKLPLWRPRGEAMAA